MGAGASANIPESINCEQFKELTGDLFNNEIFDAREFDIVIFIVVVRHILKLLT